MAKSKETVPNPKNATVATPIPAYVSMSKAWELIDDLLEGTRTMREAGIDWLPMFKKEKADAYRKRLEQNFLVPGFRDAVDKLAVRPFAKPVTLSVELTEPLDAIESDVDRAGVGNDLTKFAREEMTDGVARGLAIAFVDMPTIQADNRPAEDGQAARPTFKRISPSDMIAWEWDIAPDGTRIMVEARWKETHTEKVGEWGQEEVEFIRVLRAASVTSDVDADGNAVELTQQGTTELYRKNKSNNEWELDAESSGVHDYPGPGLPIVRVRFKPKDGSSDESKPPLEDIAQINLAHWQSNSRQQQYLEHIRIAALFGAGMSPEELERGITISPGSLNGSENADAKLMWVEHSGAAAEAGWRDLDRKERRMSDLAEDPLRLKSGNPTATGKAIDEAKNVTTVESWVRLLEAFLEQCYVVAARWQGVELPEDFGIDVWSDFSIALSKGADLEMIFKMRSIGDLSRRTAQEEFQRRGVIGDRVDLDEEESRIDEEAPPLASLGDPTEPGPSA